MQAVAAGLDPLDAFREHRAKELYTQFIGILQRLLNDELVYLKKQILQVLMDMLGFEEERRFILRVAINKLGDNDRKFSGFVAKKLTESCGNVP
jgi:hypothetical protein